jgi:hypothetical protein
VRFGSWGIGCPFDYDDSHSEVLRNRFLQACASGPKIFSKLSLDLLARSVIVIYINNILINEKRYVYSN